MEPNWEEVAFKLWRLLDNIDTAGDAVKGDNKAYREVVQSFQGKRWTVLNEKQVDALYGKFMRR